MDLIQKNKYSDFIFKNGFFTMTIKHYDIVLLTQKDYIEPIHIDGYIENILKEDRLLTQALEQKGLRIGRTYWDNEDFDWSKTRFALFRATWDYCHRFTEFNHWLETHATQVQFINPYPVIQWNMDKKYLGILREKGINIPPTIYLDRGEQRTLNALLKQSGWDKVILKPAIAGGARHTYLFDTQEAEHFQDIFQNLISNESMLIQEFQENIRIKGEVSLMVFGGQFSHAILKKAKTGDFRVQDDFGGTIHPYNPSENERNFAEHVIAKSGQSPVYARVDVMWDNHNELCLSELEMIEPELWFRMDEHSAPALADALYNYSIF